MVQIILISFCLELSNWKKFTVFTDQLIYTQFPTKIILQPCTFFVKMNKYHSKIIEFSLGNSWKWFQQQQCRGS